MSEVIRITVHEANGLSGGFFGSKDPYVIIRMGGHKVHTTSITNAGKNPKWEQSFTLAYNNEETLDLTVMDKDTATKDDLMGEGYLDLSPLRAAKRMTTNVPITRKNKPAGTLRITVVLKGSYPTSPNGNHQYPNMAQPMAVPLYNYQMAPPVFNMGGYPGGQYPPPQYMPMMPPNMGGGGMYYQPPVGHAYPPPQPAAYPGGYPPMAPGYGYPQHRM